MTQKEALDIMKTGVNVFLCGNAGSGKTFLLKEYIKYLNEHNIKTAVTASTGIASVSLGGLTIHSFSGIGIKESISPYELDKMEGKKYLWDRIHKTKVLIIDEVSMLHASTLDLVDLVFKKFKRNDLPFGGVQVVLSGDFFQLPPIKKGEESGFKNMIMHANSWQKAKFAICYLTEQFRQKDDKLFLDILNSIREGALKEDFYLKLEERTSFSFSKNIEPTKLYTHNVDVDKENDLKLHKIEGEKKIYNMYSSGKDILVEILKKSVLAKEILELKIGAEVMFLKNNFDLGYANGTRGVVVGFGEDDLPLVKIYDGKEVQVPFESWAIEDDGKALASVYQIPLRLAWAITIHKSQGMSIDFAEIDLSSTFSFGMGYVALSRVRTLQGLKLLGVHKNAFLVDPGVLDFDKKLKKESEENVKLFTALKEKEQKELEENFIFKMGGTLKKVEEKDKTEKTKKVSTIFMTKELLEKKLSIEEIAKKRNLSFNTILGHVEEIVKKDKKIDLSFLKVSKKHIEIVKKANEKIIKRGKEEEQGKLTPLKIEIEKMGKDLSFDEIRLARLFL